MHCCNGPGSIAMFAATRRDWQWTLITLFFGIARLSSAQRSRSVSVARFLPMILRLSLAILSRSKRRVPTLIGSAPCLKAARNSCWRALRIVSRSEWRNRTYDSAWLPFSRW